MPADLSAILKIEVPVIVCIGSRQMTVEEVLAMAPGTIIELSKSPEEELEIQVNNKAIGAGRAVKVGENFGVQVSYLGDLRIRIGALGRGVPKSNEPTQHESSAPAEQLAST